ncbi:hypothetical protein GCM10023321_55850 [Pseudonocardia eucalypti]|uniref:Uncharacterized protein n=1 Tax=Pseudonocardia eucalypti TaxID=648755 RepID=A0ABP9QQE3_9PSEU|nr:hypothetical protein [Pseudonocardia eucalypti]
MDVRPVDEFVHFIVLNGHTADLLNEHVRKFEGDTCASCGKIWPCNMRRVAERALRRIGLVGPIRSSSLANMRSNYVIF